MFGIWRLIYACQHLTSISNGNAQKRGYEEYVLPCYSLRVKVERDLYSATVKLFQTAPGDATIKQVRDFDWLRRLQSDEYPMNPTTVLDTPEQRHRIDNSSVKWREKLTIRERGGEGRIHYGSFQGILTEGLGKRPFSVKSYPNDSWHRRQSTVLWRTTTDLLPLENLSTKTVWKQLRLD